jgi:M6 family metalloprotease-like protein
MRNRALILSVTALSLALTPTSQAAVKAGATCTKAGATSSTATTKFTCVKSGKKLAWNKGVAIAKPVVLPAPTSTPSPSPTPSPTVVPVVDKTAACKLPIADGRGDVSIGGWPRIADRMRTTGTVNVQVIMVDFPDAAAKMTPQAAFAMISGASATFSELSYGRMNYTLIPNYKWYRMKSNSTTYAPLNKSFDSHRAYIAEALAMADPDVDFSNSDAFVILANPDSTGIGNSGPAFSSVFGRGFTLDGKYIANGVTSSHDLNSWKSIWLNHETTHTMGLVDVYAATPGGGSDYWDWHRYTGQFSLMGWSSFDGNAPGLFAYERWYLGWLDDAQINCSATDTTQLITPVESSGGVKALMIPLSQTKEIVIESRRPIGLDKNLKKSGAVIYLVDSTKQSGMGPVQIYPIDLKSDPTYVNAPRTVGESVTLEGYTITVTASDSSGDTVSVKRG